MTTGKSQRSIWDQAARDADLTILLPGGVPLFFRRVPAGTFLMGSRGFYRDEEPIHRVLIPRDFFLGTFVVTQAQYRAVASRCPALKERKDAPWNRAWSRRRSGTEPATQPLRKEK